jgi:hypothetical protein
LSRTVRGKSTVRPIVVRGPAGQSDVSRSHHHGERTFLRISIRCTIFIRPPFLRVICAVSCFINATYVTLFHLEIFPAIAGLLGSRRSLWDKIV